MDTDPVTDEDLPLVDDAPSRQLVEIVQGGNITPGAMKLIHNEVSMNDHLPGLSFNEPTALLLDVNNLFKRAKDNNFRIDYSRLKMIFENRCDLRHCAAFSAVDRSNREANDWVELMKKLGYSFIGKELVRYTGQGGRAVAKGNMDIEMTIHAMNLSPAFTHVIIGSCDGDFVPLVQELQKDYVRKVSVLGISGPSWAGMSRSLVNQAHNFYDLFRLQDQVNYRGERNV